MALRWNLEDVDNFEELKVEINEGRPGDPREELKAFVSVLISQCGLVIGIPCITEDNWKEVYLRSYIVTKVLNMNPVVEFTEDDINRRPVSAAEVRRCVGLTTNGREYGRDEFIATLFENLKQKSNFKEEVRDVKATQ